MKHLTRWRTVTAGTATAALAVGAFGLTSLVGSQRAEPDPIEFEMVDAEEPGPVVDGRSSDEGGSPAPAVVSDPSPDTPPSPDSPTSPVSADTPDAPASPASAPSPASPASAPSPASPASAPSPDTPASAPSPDTPASPASADSPESVDSPGSTDS